MCEKFDVGYVMRQVRAKEEEEREEGPRAGAEAVLRPRRQKRKRKLTK